jgi:predicted dehydrogenase
VTVNRSVPISLGVIGAGISATIAHIPAALRSNDFDLLAILDRDRSQLERFDKTQLPHLCDQPDDFFSIKGMEAVIVATPDATHADLVSRALDHGLHVLVEKPMARNLDECERLVGLAAARGVVLAVGHEKRFHPTFARVGAMLAQGAIGDPFLCGVHWASTAKLDARFIPKGFEPGYRWRWEDAGAGGGILQDHLPHYVDLLRHWTGSEPSTIYALVENVARQRLGWPADASIWEDFAIAVVRFSGGLTFRFETGVVGRSLSPLWSLGSGVGEWTEYGYVLGTTGQVLFDLLPWDSTENGRIAVWEKDRALSKGHGWSYVEQPEPQRRSGGAAATMFGRQLAEWACAIRGEPSDVALGHDGLVTIATVRAGYESARCRAEVKIPTMKAGVEQ